MTEPTVRAATVDDAPAIADIHIRSWQHTYRGIVPDRILDGFDLERRTSSWRERLTAELADPGIERRTWVVERDDVVVGVAATGPTQPEGLPPRTGELILIYVAPEALGRGNGRLLMEHLTRDLVERGFAPLILWVLEANDRARRFYEMGGWRTDGASQPIDFDGTAVDEIRYRLDPTGTNLP